MSGLAVTDPSMLGLALLVAVLAGVVKGVVGFAMPMIILSGLGSFLSPELALAGLILPTLVTNVAQSLKGGLSAALSTFRDFWRLNLILVATILVVAQTVTALPKELFYALMGIPVLSYALIELSGRKLVFPARYRRLSEIAAALIAGFFGGVSGSWGPAVVAYFLSLDMPKAELVRAQGVCYLLGSFFLAVAHLNSGILNAATIPFSALLILPGLAGLWVGFRLHDRIDIVVFRRVMLIVLAVAGLNLIRRAILG